MKAFWTVVIVIVVLAVVGYGGYRIYHHYTWKPAPTSQVMTPSQTVMKPKQSTMMAENSVYKMMSVAKLGNIVTDVKGMTLYTFTKDTAGVSNCKGPCLTLWPAYVAQSMTEKVPANVSVIKRSDGTLQYAWKGMPLYYYSKDKKAGDTTGNGFSGLWSVVK